MNRKTLKRPAGRPAKPAKERARRVGISLSATTHTWAVELAQRQGFSTNLSAFFQHLIAKEQERVEERMIKLGQINADQVNPDRGN